MSAPGASLGVRALLVSACVVFVLTQRSIGAGAREESPSAALPSPLTLDAALAVFRTRGFDLLLADAAVQDAEADVTAAGAVPNPNLDATVGKTFYNVPPGCSGCSTIPWSVGLSDQGALVNVLSGKRGLRVKVARAAVDAAKMSREDARRTLEFSIKQEYVGAVLAQVSLDIARAAQASAQQTADLVSTRYKAGAVSEADLAKVETAQLEADQAVDSATQALQSAKVTLAFLLGVRGLAPAFDIDRALLRNAASVSLKGASREQLYAEALRHRPDLMQASFERKRAAASIDLAKRLRFPDIGLSVQYAQEGTGQNALLPPTVTFGVSMTLPMFYQYQGEIQKAQADLRTQSVQLSKTESQIAAEVDGAYSAYLSNRSRLLRMESQLLEKAARARDLTRIQYEKGSASLLEFLDAQRTYLAVNAEYSQILDDYWTSIFTLEQAVGTELRK